MTKKLKAASTSVTVNIVLLVSKIIVAIITSSVALFAECAHSLFDLFSSILAFWGIKQAGKPSDDEHLFGHDKYESLSSLLQAVFITLTALFIMYEATDKLLHPHPVENSGIGIIVMIITIPIAFLTSRYLAKVAKNEGGSHALEADSAHFTTDILGSISVLVGLIIVNLGYALGDVFAAYAVSIIMIIVSFKIMHNCYYVFMDCSPDKETMDKIKEILDSVKCISYHKLKARTTGSNIFIDVHIQVRKDMSVEKAHDLIGKIKTKLRNEIKSIKEVSIHIEPK